jgi:outer membrane protein TolC
MPQLRLLTLLYFGLFATTICAQTPLRLEEAMQLALENNHGILIAKYRSDQASMDASLGNAGFLPTLAVDGTRNYSVTDVNQTFQDGRKIENNGIKANNYNVGPRLEWTLFDGFAMFLRRDQLQQLDQVGQLQFRARVEATLAELIMAYFNVARQQKLLQVFAASIEISQQRLKIAEDKFDVGSGARVEVLQAQVALNEDQSAWRTQQVQLKNAQLALNTLMGVDPSSSFELNDQAQLGERLMIEALLGQAKQSNPMLQMARMEVDLARLNLRLTQSSTLPSLTATGSYIFTGSQNRAGFFVQQDNQGFNYGLVARWPLFDGFNKHRSIQQARIDQKIAETEWRFAQQELESELLAVYTKYTNDLELLRAERENLLVAQENADIALERFQLGTYTPVELREAQQALLNTESRLASAIYGAKATETQLLYLSGQLRANGSNKK